MSVDLKVVTFVKQKDGTWRMMFYGAGFETIKEFHDDLEISFDIGIRTYRNRFKYGADEAPLEYYPHKE